MTTRPISRPRALGLVLFLLLGLLALSAPAATAQGIPWSPPVGPTGFVQMSDGVQIAVNVRMPNGFVEGQRYPTIFEMSGYDGASNNEQTLIGYTEDEFPGLDVPVLPNDGSRQLTRPFYGHYATVHASVRGSGCSGGEFDLFSSRSALDGREVIEWIARQPWSNGDVGIMGHSYSGITGFLVAATQPPPLVAMTVSGLIDDVYRGIVYPGGVSNYGFPLLWTGAIRPAYDYLGGQAQPILTDANRIQCAANIATHTRTVLNDPIVQGLSDTDNDWYRARSLMSYVDRIDVPIHIVGAYQDEQTSARGPAHLWESVSGVPKRLVLTNGNHGTNQSSYNFKNERVPWMDHWMRGVDHGYGALEDDEKSVDVHLETRGGKPGAVLSAADFPIPSARYQKWFLRGDGGLSKTAPAAGEGSSMYVSGSKRQSWNYEFGSDGRAGSEFTTPAGPDEVTFRSEPVTVPTAVIGHITAELFLSSLAPDTEVFVQVIDEGPDGSMTYLQRGLLKASHRAYNHSKSDTWVEPATGQTVLIRPFRPHTSSSLLTPNRVYHLLVEVWPVGHVFRPGHRIVVKVMAPPASDSLNLYIPKTPPTLNTIYHDLAHPSKLNLPMVPLTGIVLGPEVPCGAQDAVRCIPG